MTNTTNAPVLPESELEKLKDKAVELGKEHGDAGARWVSIPDVWAAKRVLTAMDDGDPALDDMIGVPSPLSGEWADGLTPASLLETLGAPEDMNEFQEQEIMDAYEQEVQESYVDEVARRCRYLLD